MVPRIAKYLFYYPQFTSTSLNDANIFQVHSVKKLLYSASISRLSILFHSTVDAHLEIQPLSFLMTLTKSIRIRLLEIINFYGLTKHEYFKPCTVSFLDVFTFLVILLLMMHFLVFDEKIFFFFD